MKKMNILATLTLSLVLNNTSIACTGSTVQVDDGTQLFGRTMEFAVDLQSNVIIVPRNYTFTSQGVDKQPGLRWTGKYAAVGANGKDLEIIVDGLNEKGLSVGTFYFPGYADYQEVSAEESKQSVSSYELGIWLLTNFANVDEAKAGLSRIKVSKATFQAYNIVLPLHYILNDASGKSLVVEYINGKLHTYDNPIRVLTNAPSFDWHMTNLNNYINLTPMDTESKALGAITLKKLGQGTGLHGIPGDFTPPSRFIRSAFFSAAYPGAKDAQSGVQELFHILNHFDTPKGSVVETLDGKKLDDITQWTSANDMSNKVFYYHTYGDRAIRKVDLKQFDLNAKNIKVVTMDLHLAFMDESKNAKAFRAKKIS